MEVLLKLFWLATSTARSSMLSKSLTSILFYATNRQSTSKMNGSCWTKSITKASAISASLFRIRTRCTWVWNYVKMVQHLPWHKQCLTSDILLKQTTAVAAGFANNSVAAGELYDQIHKRKQIDVQDARFYAAEIVLMLQRLRQEKASFGSFSFGWIFWSDMFWPSVTTT